MKKELDQIQTERLIFRGISEEDAEDIVGWRSDPDVFRYFKSPHKISVEEHLNWFRNSYIYNQDRFDWMCIRKDTGENAGVFGLIREGDRIEVNYLLDKKAQHRGFAYEGIKALADYARDVLHEKLVIAEIHKDNTASIAVVGKLGFRLIDSHDDVVIYGLEV